MTGILLTQNGTPIIGDVAKLMGWIMNALFNFLDGVFGIQNIGLCIILFTIIIYLLMLPGLLWYIIFCYLPMFGIIIAFEDYKPFWGIQGIFTSNWVGGKHFLKFFKSAYCFRLIKNTLLLSIYSLIWSFPLSIILALFINELKGKFFKKTVQTVSYLPHFLSAVIVCGMIRTLTSVDGGLVNAIVTAFGGEAIPFLGQPEWFRSIYTISEVWQSIGWESIVFIAAMMSIDKELYEAATRIKEMKP